MYIYIHAHIYIYTHTLNILCVYTQKLNHCCTPETITILLTILQLYFNKK